MYWMHWRIVLYLLGWIDYLLGLIYYSRVLYPSIVWNVLYRSWRLLNMMANIHHMICATERSMPKWDRWGFLRRRVRMKRTTVNWLHLMLYRHWWSYNCDRVCNWSISFWLKSLRSIRSGLPLRSFFYSLSIVERLTTKLLLYILILQNSLFLIDCYIQNSLKFIRYPSLVKSMWKIIYLA
jgi:hypothetical protein